MKSKAQNTFEKLAEAGENLAVLGGLAAVGGGVGYGGHKASTSYKNAQKSAQKAAQLTKIRNTGAKSLGAAGLLGAVGYTGLVQLRKAGGGSGRKAISLMGDITRLKKDIAIMKMKKSLVDAAAHKIVR